MFGVLFFVLISVVKVFRWVIFLGVYGRLLSSVGEWIRYVMICVWEMVMLRWFCSSRNFGLCGVFWLFEVVREVIEMMVFLFWKLLIVFMGMLGKFVLESVLSMS